MIEKRINQKLKEIQDSLDLIEENIPLSLIEFKNMGLIKDGIYKRLEYCIQNILDILLIIYSSLRLEAPSSVDDILDELINKKVLPKDIINLVKEMKGLRNILAHRYGKIDDTLIYNFLTESLTDFNKITSSIEKYRCKK